MKEILPESLIANNKAKLKNRLYSANIAVNKTKNTLTARGAHIVQKEEVNLKEEVVELQQISMKTVSFEKKIQPNHEPKDLQSCKELQTKKVPFFNEFMKNEKVQKSQLQKNLMKGCNKTKLVYFNPQLSLKGNQRFIVVSADYLINENNFWEKRNTQQAHKKYTQHFRSISIHTDKKIPSRQNSRQACKTSAGNGRLVLLQERKNLGVCLNNHTNSNPLFGGQRKYEGNENNPNAGNNQNHSNTTLIKNWRTLHNQLGSKSSNIVVLWIIRREASFTYLMNFARQFELPLHGVFFTKRKRSNYFYDINPIINQIYNRHKISILQNLSKNCDNPLQTEVKIQINTTTCITTKNSRPPKPTPLLKTNKHNQTPLQFKKSIKIRQFSSVAWGQGVNNSQNNQNCPNSLNKINSLNLKKGNQRQKISADSKIKDQEKREKNEIKTLKDIKTSKCLEENPRFQFKIPEIYIFDTINCNRKDQTVRQSYAGKMPVCFQNSYKRYCDTIQKLKEKFDPQSQQFAKLQNLSQKILQTQSIRIYYKQQQHSDASRGLESICSTLKQTSQSSKTPSYELLNEIKFSLKSILDQKARNFLQAEALDFLLEYSEHEDSKSQKQIQAGHESTRQNTANSQLGQLEDEEEELLKQKTEQKIESLRKQMIDKIISWKGRGYTFENGQSVYYYVGSIFKRNYNKLYQDVRKNLLKEICDKKNKKLKSAQVSKKTFPKNYLQKEKAKMTDRGSRQIKALNFSEFAFFNIVQS